MTDLLFLKALRDKLKGGNAKSIHLNALPGRYAVRLDLAHLNYIKPSFAESFLELLLNTPRFEFKISFDSINLTSSATEEQKRLMLLSKRLNSINIENDDNFKEHGIKTFGFGFPILIKPSKQDPKKIIKAPLFIWQLEIIKATNKVNTWSILRNKVRNENGQVKDEDIHSVGLNEVLLAFLKTDENLAIPQINDELLEDAVIDRNELINECYKVLKALNTGTSIDIKQTLLNKLGEPLKNIPESSALESISGNMPWIYFGGVFGLFRTQKESIITDIDKLIERFDDFEFEDLKVENFSGTPHSAVETDPSQQEILATLGVEPKKIIQGPPGTGKSQSLTALITNALANNLKCLVVCEKKNALDVIKKNLHRENDQLGNLAAVIEDINKDRDSIVNSVRDRIRHPAPYVNFNQNSYSNALEVIETKVQEINHQHKQLDKKIYAGKSWTKLVGEFLKRQKVADYTELKTKLDFKKFKFHDDEKELSELLSKIRTAKQLYADVKRLDHPLEILNDALFQENIPKALQIKLEDLSLETSKKLEIEKAELQNQLAYYRKWLDSHYSATESQITELEKRIKADIDNYKQWLDKHYKEYYDSVKEQINNYLNFAFTNHKKFGELFYKNDKFSKLKIKVLSLISAHYKSLRNNRNSLTSLIQDIKEAQQKFDCFTHDYIEAIDKKTLRVYVENIESLDKAIEVWNIGVDALKDNYLNRFSANDLHNHYSELCEKIRATENLFDEIIFIASEDKQLEINSQSPINHASRLIECEKVLQQLHDKEKFKQHYIYKYSSNFFHPLFTEKASSLNAEINFEKILLNLQRQKILKRVAPNITNHHQKISEAEILEKEMKIISDNLGDFREYFDWKQFYIALIPLQRTVINSLIEAECENWEASFESWYYHWLVAISESHLTGLPKNEYNINELVRWKEEFKQSQIKSITTTWSARQIQTIRKAQVQGINPVNLYNKKGGKGERRNSLRKIIKTDFEIFTSFFPVVMLSPTVCSSILPLEEAIFDIVIFDEASQLRLEDTFPALVRGKIKVVSGDSQQMPPSNFFQGGSALLNPTDDDYEEEKPTIETIETNRNINRSLDLADSESLLVYAENCSYKPSYLKIHYRSQHPYLIDFSNHAFYGKRLIPMPARQEYKPIHFTEVNGLYEDQTNPDEAKQVINILLTQIKPLQNGKYPSVGVATFNLYQRNLILEEISKVRQQNPEYDKKFIDLGSDFFVKNLENIQGDERDIIIISTTFGRKSDGNFRQNFGPIVQGKGYKLLNVIITRAKYRVYVCTSIPFDYINQYRQLLQQSKNTGRGVFYAYLAYAKAVNEGNVELREAILKQLYENCDARSFDVDDNYGSESPFEEEVYYRLAKKIGQERLQQQYPIGGFRIDLVVNSKLTGKPIIAIECDGAKYHSSNEAYAWDIFRQSQLEKQGFNFYRIWSTNWWNSEEKELSKLVDFINQTDKF